MVAITRQLRLFNGCAYFMTALYIDDCAYATAVHLPNYCGYEEKISAAFQPFEDHQLKSISREIWIHILSLPNRL
jgi:hypothetical protein